MSTWGRFLIRRAAILDARHRMPLPSMQGSVSTPFREALWTRRDKHIAMLYGELTPILADIQAKVATAEHAIESLRAQLDAATDELARATAEQIDVQVRRRGDEHASEQLVASRRTRERATVLKRLRAQRDRLQQAVVEQQRLSIEQLSYADEACRAKAVHARLTHFEALARRDLYDRELLRRHPQRQLVAYCLDTDAKELPSWVDAALADEDRENES
jgi:hypothetical protein